MPKLLEGKENSKGKIILVTPYDDEGEDQLLPLTVRQRQILLTLAEYLNWKSRWGTLPDGLDNDDTRDEYVADIKDRLMQVINFCEKFIECITSDSDVQQALKDYLSDLLQNDVDIQNLVQNISYNNNNPGLPSKPGTSGDIIPTADCDKDKAAGFVKTGIIDRAFENCYQMFDEMIAATTDDQKKLAFIDAVPVLGAVLDELLVTDIVSFVANISVWIKSQFETEDTTALRERYYRDLLCIYMQNCSISIEQIRDYFWTEATKVNSGFNDAIGTAVDLYNFLINGTDESFEGIVPVLMGIQFGGAYFIDSLFNMPLAEFKLLSALGDPTDDWIAWEALYGECDCYIEYIKPDNPIPDLTVVNEYGLIGFTDALAYSTHDRAGGDDNTAWIITDNFFEPDGLEVENLTRVWIITDTPEVFGGEIYGDTFFTSNANFGFYIAPGKYANEFVFDTPVTGHITALNFRKEIGNSSDFKWIALRLFFPC